MIHYRKLRDRAIPDVEHHYSVDDAPALGPGDDPMDEALLAFVDEAWPGSLQVLPSMAVVLCFAGSWMQDPGTGIDVPNTAPVIPGDPLRFEPWREGAEIMFRTRAVEGDQSVLDFGRAVIVD